MPIEKIIKRNGDIADFDRERIVSAVARAAQATQAAIVGGVIIDLEFVPQLVDEVVDALEAEFSQSQRIPHVEHIQDIVEHKLVEAGQFEVAKTYILYRADHARKRAERRIEELAKIDKGLLKVTKHEGESEIFRVEKIKKVFAVAVQGFEPHCSFDELYERLKLTIVDNIKSAQIMKNLRKVCLDLVSVNNIHWQNIAGRLYIMDLYKQASRNRRISINAIYSPEAFRDHFNHYIKIGRYTKDFYAHYTPEDILEAGRTLNKERDLTYIYSTVLAFDRRYLLNPNKDVQELPQEMYMAIALFLAIPEHQEKRLAIAKKIYEVVSSQKLSLPTPTLLNARTNFHQLSSCFKLNVNDDLRAIYHSLENMAQISKFGGGVGVYLGHVRSKGAAIRELKGASGGVIPWVRLINNTASAVNQLGARLGAISPTLDIWHRDVLDFLNLQVESGDIRAKAFDIFPAISVPDIFMRRVKANQDWTLFDPHEILKHKKIRLEDSYGEEFDRLYEACEKDPLIATRVTIPAKELMKRFLKTVVETGMPYVFFRDTVNELNPNKHAGRVYSTQLCTEICQNTSDSIFSGERMANGQVSLNYVPGDTVVCNLASINVARVHSDDEIREIFPIALRVLDNVITLNFYPIKEAELTAKRYRSVGLGFMGLAEYLACRGLSYGSPEAREHVDTLFEKYGHATLKASSELAKERGAYELFPGSEWSKGILFGHDADWFRANAKESKSWLDLIEEIKKTGLRFAYHLAPAPNTSTASVMGTTAGLLPIYKKFFVETNVIAPVVTVAPNLSTKNFWHYKEYIHMDMNEVIEMIATVYKWIDQSVSFEWLINPSKTSPAELYGYYMKAWEMKIKTVYYLRSMSGDVKEGCSSCSG
ncbi:MAG: ribonucleoside-diphosphate reductase subunit alpha [Candidatus Omnitrophica bacterium]|nr:ribonucleoside-diphosphate reductase subunit alpha [Candidatus Omnitrophota bacterium]